MSQKRPELLIPASSLEVLKTAVMFGADAVYIGGEAFGLRAKAKNFSMEDMKKGVEFQQRGYGRGNRLCACTWCKSTCDGQYSCA